MTCTGVRLWSGTFHLSCRSALASSTSCGLVCSFCERYCSVVSSEETFFRSIVQTYSARIDFFGSRDKCWNRASSTLRAAPVALNGAVSEDPAWLFDIKPHVDEMLNRLRIAAKRIEANPKSVVS